MAKTDVHFTLGIEGDVICLTDLGTGRSITSGAEQVIADLRLWFRDECLNSMRVIYRDTLGNWDGLAHRDGRFLGFVSLGGIKDRRLAIEAARVHSWQITG